MAVAIYGIVGWPNVVLCRIAYIKKTNENRGTKVSEIFIQGNMCKKKEMCDFRSIRIRDDSPRVDFLSRVNF